MRSCFHSRFSHDNCLSPLRREWWRLAKKISKRKARASAPPKRRTTPAKTTSTAAAPPVPSRRANAEFEACISTAAHNLREPLRDVTSFTQLMAESYAARLGSEADLRRRVHS